MKIRTRLFLAFVMLVGLGFYKLVDWVVDDLRPRYLETMEESMIDLATVLSSFVGQQVEEESIVTSGIRKTFDTAQRKRFSARIYQVTKTNLNIRVYVTDAKGTVVFDSSDGRDEGRDYSRWNDVARTMRGEYGARTTPANPDDPTASVLHVASPITASGEIVGVLTVCKPADSVTLFLHAAKRKIMLAGTVVALVVVLLGTVISSWITWPIQKLTDYAKSVRDGKRVSLPKLGRSEIGQLGAAFEEMRDALEGKQYVENYVQTLTHEMKSPLSAIRGASELLQEDMSREQRRQFLDNIHEGSVRIQDLVDRMLQLSALEKRKGLREIEDIDLTILLQDLVESMKPLLAAKDITVAVERKSPMVVKGELFLVRQATLNLFQNAIDFGSKGGSITAAVQRTDDYVEIVISDNGPGVPAYALDRVFDRFYSLQRPDTGKKSSGLGLTFAREVAILHGGKVTIDNDRETGATATLSLPFVPPGTAD